MAGTRAIRSWMDHWPLAVICTAAFIFYTLLVCYQYVHLVYSDWDLAAYNQFFWGLVHGQFYSSLYGFHCWGEHAGLIDVAVAAFLALFPSPLTFVFLQIIFFVLSAAVLHRIASDELGPGTALTITALYLVFPANLLAMINDPNPEALSPFFILTAVLLYREKRLGAYYLALFFLLGIKENIALIVAMLGLWGVFAKDRPRFPWGAVPLVAAIVYFVFAAFWFVPHFRGIEQHPLLAGRYGHLGAAPHEVLLGLLSWKTWAGVAANPMNIGFICSLFGILLVPALLSPSVLLLMVPILAQHLLSGFPSEKSIYYFYSLTMTPVIFLATVHSLKKGIAGIPTRIICIILIGGCLLQLFSLREQMISRVGIGFGGDAAANWRLVRKIPDDAGVVATFRFLPALSLREHLYSFHKIISRPVPGERLMRERYFDVPSNSRSLAREWYALIDHEDGWIRSQSREDAAYIKGKIAGFLLGWEEVGSEGSVKLYKWKGRGR